MGSRRETPRAPGHGREAVEDGRKSGRPVLVDACLLFNEIDLLEIRLGELWEVVDRFVIVESDRTFAGRPKPFFFEEFSSRFRPFAGKIAYHKFVDPFPRLRAGTRERMDFEARQRNAIGLALESCGLQDEDVVLLGDVDEIPRVELVASLPMLLHRKQFCIFVLRNLRGYLNSTSAAGLNGAPFLGPVACRWKTFRATGADEVRRGEGRAGHVLQRKDRRWTYVDDGGWHLSSVGGAEAFWVKAQNFSHLEDPHRLLALPEAAVPIEAFAGPLSRQQCLASQARFLQAGGPRRFSPLGFDEFRIAQDLPRYLIANKERFRRFFFFTDVLDPGRDDTAEVAALSDRPTGVGAILAQGAVSLLKGLARSVLRPTLHQARQYRPRRLRIPSSYREQEPPEEPLSIAVVTPSWNQAPFIRATIDSVLGQGYPRLAYMVVDGSSTDGTVELLSRQGGAFDWSSEPDTGQAQAVNKGFACISGNIMGWLNSDDMLLPGALMYVAKFFSDHPAVDIIYGHRIYIDSAGLETGRTVLPPHDARALRYFDFVPQETLFWRNRVWASLVGLDESLEFTMDWDFLLRAAAAGFVFHRVPRFLGCFRWHTRQKSNSLATRGEQEADRLRARQFPVPPGAADVQRAILGYRFRQAVWQWGYRLGWPGSS